MPNLSIVIVCKNEANAIAQTLSSLEGLTDDIIVYDNGSEDGTQAIISSFPVRLIEGSWEGFGKTKNKANELAKYDWILSLDADEAIDDELRQTLKDLQPKAENIICGIRFKNFLGTRHLKYGEWGHDIHSRLFNRKITSWDDAAVHERLVSTGKTQGQVLKGHILHRTAADVKDYAEKTVRYALLNAEKYYKLGKKASWIKTRLSPVFSFFSNYILRAGFLDGYAGWVCARMTAYYTFLKYTRLHELNKMKDDSG